MTRRRYWTIVAVLFALAPVFYFNDGVRLQTTSLSPGPRLVVVLLPGMVALGAAIAFELGERNRRS